MKKILKWKRKGQSTLEYLVGITGITVAAIAFWNGGTVQSDLTNTWTDASGQMRNLSQRLVQSQGTTP